MHNFSELIYRCSVFTLTALKEVEEKTIDALQTSGATSSVKILQMIRLNKAIFAIGAFSSFEAILQDCLNCDNGFSEAKNILKQSGDTILLNQFSDLELAINALKHGRGRSYDALISKDGGTITSQVKQPTDNFFDEGDVSEISGLVKVDDEFIYDCVEVINDVAKVIQANRPDVFL